VSPSRNPTPRPRRVAGQARRASDSPAVVEEAQLTQVPSESGASRDQVSEAPAEPQVVEPDESPGTEPEPELEPELEDPPPARRTTVALVLAIVLLVAAALLEAAYLWGPLADDPKVSAARPVVTSEAQHRSVVDAAAQAAVTFSGRSYETYDEQVDKATATMTDSFAEEYRQTTDQVREDWIEQQTIVVAELEAQAVITASDKQVEALVFLTQFIERKGAQAAVTPYRLKVTMVETDQGWLVSDVESA